MESVNQTIGKYRWTICSLVFFATTINYLDRQVISLLKPILEEQFSWSEKDYSHITMAFTIAYALGFIGVGRLIDKIGTKLGYALSLTVWSIAAVLHAFAKSTFGFGAARALLGVSEAGNFPAAIKTIAEWFPKKERALATGIFNSGSNVGAIIAPIAVPWIAVTWGWQMAFILTGAVGFTWLIFWMLIYEIPAKHKKLSKVEYEYIHSDAEEIVDETKERISWFKLLQFKQTWSFVLGKFLTDPIWWFLLFWLPSFLKEEYGMVGTQISFPIAVVYMISSIGSIGGGWLSGYLISKGWPIFKARKSAMLFFACCVLPIIAVQALGKFSPWIAVLIIGLATAAHQAWSANIFTTSSDMFPKKAVASIVGLGGMAGALGGVTLQWVAGLLLDYYKNLHSIETAYYILFIVAGSAYLTAWLIMHMLTPQMKTVDLDD